MAHLNAWLNAGASRCGLQLSAQACQLPPKGDMIELPQICALVRLLEGLLCPLVPVLGAIRMDNDVKSADDENHLAGTHLRANLLPKGARPNSPSPFAHQPRRHRWSSIPLAGPNHIRSRNTTAHKTSLLT